MTETVTAPLQAPTPTPSASAPRPVANSATAKKLLTRARGATIAELQAATGWQPHSTRAFLSGLRKAGRTLVKEERKSGETSYRLAAAPLSAVSEASE